jgi:hypothetical protein
MDDGLRVTMPLSLVKAAPDLLAACETAYDALAHYGHNPDVVEEVDPGYCEKCDVGRALARARGEA